LLDLFRDIMKSTTASSKSESRANTIYDLARATGLSKTTVSSALSGSGRISPATREVVLEAARRMQYEGNYYAQRLKKRCLRTIGLFSLDLDIGVETHKIKIIQRLLAGRGYDVPIYSYGSYGGGEEVDQKALLSTLRRQRPQAIVCSLSGLEADTLQELARYVEEGGIVVCYGYSDQEIEGYDQVIFDENDNTYQAARYLLELGHHEIGFYIPGVRRRHEPRLAGFCRALDEFGATTRSDWTFSSDELYEEGGGAVAARFMALEQRPSAMCIVNDHAASAFVNEVQRGGLTVPRDLSIVSHDDSPVARYSVVPLTTVSHPVEAIARNIVNFLCSRLEGLYDGVPRRVIIKGQLMVRDSAVAH
jgi:DNA-binding LacI/PurR family transcriptional regulator